MEALMLMKPPIFMHYLVLLDHGAASGYGSCVPGVGEDPHIESLPPGVVSLRKEWRTYCRWRVIINQPPSCGDMAPMHIFEYRRG